MKINDIVKLNYGKKNIWHGNYAKVVDIYITTVKLLSITKPEGCAAYYLKTPFTTEKQFVIIVKCPKYLK